MAPQRNRVCPSDLKPTCRHVLQRAERGHGLLHTDVQGAHAPGAGASQGTRGDGRKERSHLAQTLPQELPSTLPPTDGKQEHQTEAALHRGSYLVRPGSEDKVEGEKTSDAKKTKQKDVTNDIFEGENWR